jgi:hypothetical protein
LSEIAKFPSFPICQFTYFESAFSYFVTWHFFKQIGEKQLHEALKSRNAKSSIRTSHCKKKESVKGNIFNATHSVFLHQIDRGSLPSTRRGFSPAYRMGIGKNSDMEGKIPTWWEKFLLGNGTWSEKFPHSRKNSHIVGKIPT